MACQICTLPPALAGSFGVTWKRVSFLLYYSSSLVEFFVPLVVSQSSDSNGLPFFFFRKNRLLRSPSPFALRLESSERVLKGFPLPFSPPFDGGVTSTCLHFGWEVPFYPFFCLSSFRNPRGKVCFSLPPFL